MPPRPHAGLVDRPRLFARLDRRADAALTLLTAPAGSGKTDLVSSWLEQHPEWSVAWVTLDPADVDPVRFWTYVAHAVDRVRSGMARPALARLQTPGTPLDGVVDELMNGIETFEGRLVIVIDDLHHLTSGSAAESFAHAVGSAPAPVRFVATTRADPVIRLARVRARGMLAELRGADLAFTAREAKRLLVGSMGIALDDDEIDCLVERTEGWPAGINLAGLWLAEVDAPGRHVRDFAGEQRHVADFLSDEVLAAVDEETRAFLLRSSVLDRLSGPLCDAVLGTSDSQARLESLSRTMLFLVPLDHRGEWFRYHQVFRDLLRLELTRVEPEEAERLNLRASSWFLEHDHIEDALEHAAAAGDASRVVSVLAGQYMRMFRAGDVGLLLRWLHRLPDEQLRTNPELVAAGAIGTVMVGRPADERARLVRLAESSSGKEQDRERHRLGALLGLARAAALDHDLQSAIDGAERAVAAATVEGDELVVPALAALAYARYLRGDLDGAEWAVREAQSRPEFTDRPHGFVVATACSALLEVDRGRPGAAERRARGALEAARRLGLAASWSSAAGGLALGAALLARGLPAERELERAERLRRVQHPALDHVHALLLLAEARLARGRLALAASELNVARERLAVFSDAGRLPELARRIEESLADAQGNAGLVIDPPTPAELLVLRLLATDLTQRQIGERLFLSLNTVKTHTRVLYRKLGATTRVDAVRRAGEAGLFDSVGSPG